MTLPRFERWPPGSPTIVPEPRQTEVAEVQTSLPPRRAVVFVHGIISAHTTFEEAQRHMARDPRFDEVEFFYFDYDFGNAMEQNGQDLAGALCNAGFREGDEVAVVAHSMGGLVTRFAILSKPLPFVKLVFLLGTPNAGAIRLAQLSAHMQLVHRLTNQFFALYPRWSGIPSLSDAAKRIEAKKNSFVNALDVDYISIPGRYFHQERSVWDVGRDQSGIGFSALEAIFLRMQSIRLERPHDGIVEEASNDLSKCPRPTEKQDSYGGPRGSYPATYAHVTLNACNEVNHVQIHRDPDILEIVCDLTAAKFGLGGGERLTVEEWYSNVTRAKRLQRGLKISLGS